ncbi:hypothetical protein BGZ99_004906 [Dissophora globulifera]|uniref:Uncharacterized protein n=1 Tax=Dissophora globulifera TaxID=979702 RepID=A0A9P6V034_9FUNG|nr:hypothetical protein BGZ99_004906 [Dissophora globulifera]
MTSSTSDPLSNTLAPSTAATLTIRVIKSFEYRTSKNLVLHAVDLTATTVGQLRVLIIENTLKLYTKAHGAKTMNLIINMENDQDLILANDEELLVNRGIENETEISIFNREIYEAYKQHPDIKW